MISITFMGTMIRCREHFFEKHEIHVIRNKLFINNLNFKGSLYPTCGQQVNLASLQLSVTAAFLFSTRPARLPMRRSEHRETGAICWYRHYYRDGRHYFLFPFGFDKCYKVTTSDQRRRSSHYTHTYNHITCAEAGSPRSTIFYTFVDFLSQFTRLAWFPASATTTFL